jgi:hypothetical protein
LADEELLGEDAFGAELNRWALSSLQMTIPGVYVDSEKARFSSAQEYDWVVLRRGAAAMHEVRKSIGRDAFWDALGRYLVECGGGIGSIEPFARALSEASQTPMDLYLMEMLRTIGDYANQRLEVYR